MADPRRAKSAPAKLAPIEARYSVFHNVSMTVVAFLMVASGAFYVSGSATAPTASINDPRFVMFILLGIAMAYYGTIGLRRALDRTPQVTIDENGLALGFGRDKRFTWDDVQWVKLHRIAIRPSLQIGLTTEAFLGANLSLSLFSLDDPLKSIRGMPTAFALRDNGLDTRAGALFDAVRRFRPDLVKS
jgi:hypothetical protein